MKRFFTISVLFSILNFAQQKAEAESKVNEGITLHDSVKYNEAIVKYDEALNLDKNNLLALTEKTMTLEAIKKYEEAIEINQLYFNKGITLFNAKQNQKAILSFSASNQT